MRALNRSTLLVRPKEPYVSWAASVDAAAKEDENYVRNQYSIYLVAPDPNARKESAPLEWYYEEIFELELDAWHTDEAAWPENRDFDTFQKWFDVRAMSLLIDLDDSPIEVDEY